MATTGGGWQDQIGGLVPGIKCIYTDAGVTFLSLNKKVTAPLQGRIFRVIMLTSKVKS